MAKVEGAQQSLILEEEQPLLLLIDGHALVHRGWHAIQNPLTLRRTGEDVRGVYGFAQMVLRTVQSYRPTHMVITFDLPTPTFRDKLFAEYKAHRPETPQELRDQFPHVRRLMEALGVPVFEMDGYEADDLLGTLSSQAQAQGLETVILTGDTDILQLVSPHIRVHLQSSVQKQMLYDEAEVRRRYDGLGPEQVRHLKALCGDKSDNIPGIPGVGPKTAARLLLDHGDLQGIFDSIDELPAKQAALLQEHRDLVFLGLELVTIVRDVPVKLDLDASRWGRYDRGEAVEVLRDLEFHSLIGRLPGGVEEPGKPPPVLAGPGETHYSTVTDVEALQALAGTLAASGGFALDTETAPTDPEVKGIHPMRSRLVGLSFATEEGTAWYVPVGHAAGPQLGIDEALGVLRPVLEDPSVPKAAHNANYDLTVLGNHGVAVRGLAFDTMLAAHLLGHKAIGLKSMALDLLGVEMTPITDLIGTGRGQTTFDRVPVESAAPYACADSDMTLRLWTMLEERLREAGQLELFQTVEVQLLPIVVEMQLKGIAMDAELLVKMGERLGERLAELEAAAYEALGHRFNLGSPKQLGEVLFDELKLQNMADIGRPKKTRTGGYATDASTLEALSGAHPLVDLVLENRQLSKLKSTYVDALPALVNSATGRVHTIYNQAGSSTGRFSSNDPNLQNIPIRTELGRQIRRAFRPGPDGWLFLAADYSQIELRVLAHLSGDPTLLEAFRQDLDIHASTASQAYGVPLDKVTADMRRVAKVLNFGVAYGVSAYGIAQQTDLSLEEGRDFIESYFGRYPGVKGYLEETRRRVRESGYVETLLGRRRYIPEVHSSNPAIRQAAEREAINMPVQGTAAEIQKLAMIGVAARMESEGLRSNMLLQVHDELIFEAPLEEVEQLRDLVVDVMPRALELAPRSVEFAVAFKVATKLGTNWGELE